MPVAMVTGASRGVGRGVAIALLEAEFEVFATGRSISVANLPAAVHRITCDYLDDGRQELLSNTSRTIWTFWSTPRGAVTSTWSKFTWTLPFWEQPMHRWSAMLDAGVRAAFVASSLAAKTMVPHRQGLSVNISYWAARKYMGSAIYGVSKAETDKMTSDMAEELRPHGVPLFRTIRGS